jgi:rRNA maturation protein Rpf1
MVSEHRGVPHELLIELGRQFKITNFVETGTFQGNTAYWASRNFENVITVEFSEVIYKQVTEKYRDVSNIKFCFGHSTAQLAEIVPSLKSPAIFWLDAHWSGGSTYGEGD